MNRGDILLSGVASDTDDWRDLLIPALTHMAVEMGVYTPVFGEVKPLPNDVIWTHIELVENKYVGNIKYYLQNIHNRRETEFRVLKVRDDSLFKIDIERAMYRYNSASWENYSLPIFAGLIRMIYRPDLWVGQWPGSEGIFERWNELHGIQGGGVPVPVDVMWSPCLADDRHTDMNDDCFWKRTYGCSTRVMWSLIDGWGGGRNFFYQHRDRVNAVDALSPDLVASILVSMGVAGYE